STGNPVTTSSPVITADTVSIDSIVTSADPVIRAVAADTVSTISIASPAITASLAIKVSPTTTFNPHNTFCPDSNGPAFHRSHRRFSLMGIGIIIYNSGLTL
ncbi:hypothetical protein HN51_021564, partial [Arachis hypogaea]